MENPTICLNMIVRDEADIILNTLSNLVEKIPIHYWVICDTGSTDNTPELIKNFFKEKDISGELIYDPWQDFAEYEKELKESDIYTLRRITARDRGKDWEKD